MVLTKIKHKVEHKISRIKKQLFPGAIILMYHRIADADSDPWSLCVSPKNFEEQLAVLKKYGNLLSLQELNQKIREGKSIHRSIVITFDDGYADNLYNAKPLLEKYNIPATVFITTGGIDQKQEFWWDELDRILLQPGTLPNILSLKIENNACQWELKEAANYSLDEFQRDRLWNMEQEEDPTPRHNLYRSLYQKLQLLPISERNKILENIRIWANLEALGRSTHRSLSYEEITTLESGELIEIGAHTVTHPFLSTLPIATQRDEIQQSKDYLEKVLGHPVTSFSYPNGSYELETSTLVKEAGFNCACCSVADRVQSNSNSLLLPRIVVEDWNGETFTQWLSKLIG